MSYRVMLTSADGRTVRTHLQGSTRSTPKVKDTIEVARDNGIVRAQVTRVIRQPFVDIVQAREL